MINDWKDFIFVIYIVFFGAYALNTPLAFLCSAPLILLAYIGLFSVDRKTLYVLPAKGEDELYSFLDLCVEINEFQEIKVLEMRVNKEVECEKE